MIKYEILLIVVINDISVTSCIYFFIIFSENKSISDYSIKLLSSIMA